jgi:octaprenyl-diphosphate synthase
MVANPQFDVMSADMEAVDRIIFERLHSEVVLINQMGHYIVNSGGKRLRPMLVLLSSGVFSALNDRAYLTAAIIEFIHTATLLHDDVVDDSKLRRGQETANAVWGNEASVLVGDYLYSRAFEMMVDVGDMRVMEILANTTNTIAEGEVMQLMNLNDPDTSEKRYLDVIRSKTAKLFEAATRLGAVLGKSSAQEEQALANYGMHLGTAFQLIDDVLDYDADQVSLGKELGDDLAEGKPTLPLIYAMRAGSGSQQKLIRRAIEQGGRGMIRDILDAIQETGALEYTREMARQEVARAVRQLDHLPYSQCRQMLQQVAERSVIRDR